MEILFLEYLAACSLASFEPLLKCGPVCPQSPSMEHLALALLALLSPPALGTARVRMETEALGFASCQTSFWGKHQLPSPVGTGSSEQGSEWELVAECLLTGLPLGLGCE